MQSKHNEAAFLQIILWLLSFFFLVGACLSGIGASIGLLSMDYYALCLFCVGMMFSCASWADNINEKQILKTCRKSDVVRFGLVHSSGNVRFDAFGPNFLTGDNIKITFDGDSDRIKMVEII